MLLTDAQLHEIRKIIADHHSAFIANVIHPNAVDPDTLEQLKAKGLINVKINSIQDAYVYGQLLAALEDPRIAKMGYDELKLYLKRNPIPLSQAEQRAVQIAQHSAAQYVKGLGNRVDLETGQILINADTNLSNRIRDQIRTATAESIAKRETAKQLKSKLGWETKDWARDWDRIAITEMHNAHQKGEADVIAKEHGSDAKVFKRIAPDACKHCFRLHVGTDGYPRIFKLSELEKHGTNHGRKADAWEAVIGPIHCHCRCQLQRLPNGWGFDKDGAIVPGGKFGIEYGSEEDLERAVKEEMDLIKSAMQGHITFQDIPITIENLPGTTRHWKSPDGQEGDTYMMFAYGYVDGTNGKDGSDIDVFIGPDPRAKMAYIIHQQNPWTGIYDEEKVFLGMAHEEAAKAAYQAHFSRPDFAITVSPMAMDQFKRWVYAGQQGDEVLKKGKPIVKFTIPLEKSISSTGNVAPEFIETRAGHRAPGPGSVANYLFNTPAKTPTPTLREQGFDPEPRELLEQMHSRHKNKKKKSDYDYKQPLPDGTLAKPIVLPDGWPDLVDMSDEEAIEWRKKHLIKMGLQNTAAVKNKVRIT